MHLGSYAILFFLSYGIINSYALIKCYPPKYKTVFVPLCLVLLFCIRRFLTEAEIFSPFYLILSNIVYLIALLMLYFSFSGDGINNITKYGMFSLIYSANYFIIGTTISIIATLISGETYIAHFRGLGFWNISVNIYSFLIEIITMVLTIVFIHFFNKFLGDDINQFNKTKRWVFVTALVILPAIIDLGNSLFSLKRAAAWAGIDIVLIAIIFGLLVIFNMKSTLNDEKLIKSEIQRQYQYYENARAIQAELRRLKHDLANYTTVGSTEYREKILRYCNNIETVIKALR